MNLTVTSCAALRKRALAELKPGDKRSLKQRDGLLPAMLYRVHRTGDGSVKAAFWLRRFEAGREFWDRVEDASGQAIQAPDEARAVAKTKLATSPVETRKREARGETVADLVRRFIADREARGRSPKTVEEYRKLLDGAQRDDKGERLPLKGILGAGLGALSLDELTEEVVARFHSKHASTPYAANRAVALLSAACVWARIKPNPAALGRGWKFSERARALRLSDAELAAIGKALTVMEADETITAHAAGLFRALLASGCRPVELLSLTWNRVDMRSGVLRLHATKTGTKDPRRHGVPITPPLAEVLKALPKVEGNPHVFAGARGGQLLDYRAVFRKVVERAGIANGEAEHDRSLVPYILRHSAASLGALVMPLPVLKDVMGHRSISTTMKYVHIDGDPVKRAAATIAATAHAALSGRKAAR
jgi:integrase